MLWLLMGVTSCNRQLPRQGSVQAAAKTATFKMERVIAPAADLDRSGFLSGKPSDGFGATGDITVWYRDSGPNVLLTFRSRDAVIINVNVNQNGQPDIGRDLGYAVLEDGRPCVQTFKRASAPASCGDYQTSAKSALRRVGPDLYTTWSIPRQELAPNGGEPMISLQTFSAADQTSKFFPGAPFEAICKLASGGAIGTGVSSDHGRTIPLPMAAAPVAHVAKLPGSASRPAQVPLPPQPQPRETDSSTKDLSRPSYTLALSALGTSVSNGCTYAATDPHFAAGPNLILIIRYQGAIPNQTDLEVVWYRDNIPVSHREEQAPSAGGTWSLAYDNKTLNKGEYRIVLLVDKAEVSDFKFKIGTEAVPCAGQ